MSRRRLADGALSFPRYLQRMQVLTMYRQVLRSTYKIEVCPRRASMARIAVRSLVSCLQDRDVAEWVYHAP
jgi:hypothetical protein